MSLLISPISIPLVIEQGATFRREFQWRSGATEETATPVDLTGCTARAQIRETYESTTALADLTTENDGIALDALTGTITLYLADTATTALPRLQRAARWDLEIVWPDGDVTRLFEGTVRIRPEVTRD